MSGESERETRAREAREAARRRAAACGVDFLEDVPADLLDPSLVARLPVEWARAQGVLPVRWAGGIGVLTADPGRTATLDDVSRLLDAELTPVAAPADLVAACIERVYAMRAGDSGVLLETLAGDEPPAARAEAGAEDLLQAAGQAPISRLTNAILLDAVRAGASDIHFEPFENHLRVRVRVDGVLYDQTTVPKGTEAALLSRLKVMGRMDIAEKRLPQDGMARARVGDRKIDIRVSTVPAAEGERMVLRLLDRDSSLIPLGDLGMPDGVRAAFESLLAEAHGLLICSGPTGSGKTTTLYAALRRLDTARLNVMTIEDPIEYRIPGISQMQVKPKIGLTFASGLRHLLRQDPDVVLVGETRDLETAEIAVRASLTGHLVFTTLHTNDAPSAVIRLTDMGVPPYLMAAALRGVLAQRLVRTLCPACRTNGPARPAERAAWAGTDAPERMPRAGGCPACRDGFRGRMGVFELMTMTDSLTEAVRAGCGDVARLRRLAEEAGMRSLRQAALDKVRAGATTMDEVIRSLGRAGG